MPKKKRASKRAAPPTPAPGPAPEAPEAPTPEPETPVVEMPPLPEPSESPPEPPEPEPEPPPPPPPEKPVRATVDPSAYPFVYLHPACGHSVAFYVTENHGLGGPVPYGAVFRLDGSPVFPGEPLICPHCGQELRNLESRHVQPNTMPLALNPDYPVQPEVVDV